MNICFSKYQATGNDFLMINGFAGDLALTAKQVNTLCNRYFGAGADGVIIVRPTDKADMFMDLINSDGSAAEMSGNGIRCLASYAIDNELIKANSGEISIDTRAGLKTIKVNNDKFKVDMGVPSFANADIGFLSDQAAWDYPIAINGSELKVYGVSMGNPHCVIFTEELEKKLVHELGPLVENHPLFKNKTNVEWVKVDSENSLSIEVWERGAGYTLACGTGSCASFAVANRLGLVKNQASISLPGGELEVELQSGHLFLTGEAKKVYNGTIEIKE